MRIEIENRGGHDGIATGGHYGSWARIWASRPGVAKADVVEESHYVGKVGRMTPHDDHVVVDVSITADFDPENDFLLVEYKRSANPYLRGSRSQEKYELLAGVMPAWASFPEEWQRWVRNDVVLAAARAHIVEKVPETAAVVAFAERKQSKGNIRRAWDEVRRICTQATGIEIDYPDGSWTATIAIPIRIAQKLGGFVPPVPRPVWQKRDETNSFLVV